MLLATVTDPPPNGQLFMPVTNSRSCLRRFTFGVYEVPVPWPESSFRGDIQGLRQDRWRYMYRWRLSRMGLMSLRRALLGPESSCRSRIGNDVSNTYCVGHVARRLP